MRRTEPNEKNPLNEELNWGDRRGLNPRHRESQSRALPAELRPPQTGITMPS